MSEEIEEIKKEINKVKNNIPIMKEICDLAKTLQILTIEAKIYEAKIDACLSIVNAINQKETRKKE
jgi:hypothetical protein